MSVSPQTPNLDGRPSEGAQLASQMAEAAQTRAKSKDLRPLMRLLPYMGRHKFDVFFALVFLLGSTTATLSMTGASRNLIDHGFTAGGAENLNRWFVMLGAVALLLALATALRYFFVTKVGERIVADLRSDVYDHVLRLDPAFFLKTRTGEVVSRLTADIQIVETLSSTSASLALRNLLTLIGALILMAATGLKLTGLALLLIPVVILPIFVFGKQVSKLTTVTQDRFAHAVALAGESLDALETVQAFNRETKASRHFSQAIDESFKASLKRMSARAMMTAMIIALIFGGITAILWLGAHSVISGEMSAGALGQFVFLSVLAAGSVGALGETWGDLQKAAGAMTRIDELMRAEPTITAPKNPVPLPVPAKGHIRFDSVCFAYPGREDQPALNGLSFDVAPGETVALVGPSGGGKSTVLRLLLRFYDPNSGVITLDGVPLTQADPAAVRERLSLVAQDSALFSGSALENIRYGREEASQAEIEAAAQKAQADGFISQLPQGYQTPLGERARALSGGQKQRVAIARALVREAPILLLDEATSALDAENERLVQSALDAMLGSRMTLVIAHRLATVLKADRILVIDNGRVVESGTHAELVAQKGLYAHLADLQFDSSRSLKAKEQV